MEALLVQRVFLVPRVLQACKAPRALQRQEQQEPLDQPAKPVLLVQQGLAALLEFLGRLALRV